MTSPSRTGQPVGSDGVLACLGGVPRVFSRAFPQLPSGLLPRQSTLGKTGSGNGRGRVKCDASLEEMTPEPVTTMWMDREVAGARRLANGHTISGRSVCNRTEVRNGIASKLVKGGLVE
ncbi:unnamed protein product [Protopolystoma xenopodis]|uniref:Uncharacterized protein n=1 Tax=Protopolystoma xenopodis TaxID=117903 RepID=A0A3S5C3G4_9PLAT|nr:unnamed protein product [Protopolystoma xenopodis]